MRGKWLDLPREVSLSKPNTCGDIRVGNEKSAEAIVVTVPSNEGLNIKSCDLTSCLEMYVIKPRN